MSDGEILLTINRKASESPEFSGILSFLQEHCALVSLTGESREDGTPRVEAERASRAKMWVVIGGDGTLNAVLNSLMRFPKSSRPAICYLPFGTGNDFARSIGLNSDEVRSHLDEAFSEKACFPSLAIGRCNERYFINVASGGMFATITPETSGPMKNFAGRWSYFLNGLGKVVTRESIQLGVNGGKREEAIGFVVANSRFAGGGIQVASAGSPFVPRLEFLQVPDLETSELLALGLELQKDRPETSAWPIRQESVEKLRLEFSAPVPINLDGEQILVARAEFEVVPDAVRLFVPI